MGARAPRAEVSGRIKIEDNTYSTFMGEVVLTKKDIIWKADFITQIPSCSDVSVGVRWAHI